MRVLLTGITGNLGFEVARFMASDGIDVVPVVREGKNVAPFTTSFSQLIVADLLSADRIYAENIDCIVHCAGVVNFRNLEHANEIMMRTVLRTAQELEVPVFYVSTAFLYRPENSPLQFNNAYEEDKYKAEELLAASDIPHTIFRPSVLTGSTQTGAIRNFSGYYILVERFEKAVSLAKEHGRAIRFPRLTGFSNMVPVDQAAVSLVQYLKEGAHGKVVYLTNPNPPLASFVFSETLGFFNHTAQVEIIDCSFEEFGTMQKTPEEEMLYQLGTHMRPYWSLPYNFPDSIITLNHIDGAYIRKALEYYVEATRGNSV